MTTNISSIINLKYELEYKFKTKVYEQRSQAEERAKVLTSLVFTELGAFFEKMHQFSFEAELSRIDSDRSFFKSFIGTQFAFGAIRCSEIISNLQYAQDSKLSDYYSKKDEIEGKISELKSKIAAREATLTGLESQICDIETTVDTADESKINQLDDFIKVIENDLQQTQTAATNDLNEQRAVSNDIKIAAESTPTNATNQTVTDTLTNDFHRNITTAEVSLLTETIETDNTNTSPTVDIETTTDENSNQTIEVKRDIIKETTQSLRESAQKQQEIIQVEKEAIASLEKSAQTLIDGSNINTSEAGYVVEEPKISSLKNSLKAAYEALDELTTSITDAIKGKKKNDARIKDDIATTIDNMNTESKATSLEINNLIKESQKSDDLLMLKTSEVFLVSKEMHSVDKILENYKLIAENSNRIVVDKELTNVYEQLSNVLGKDKVVLDRRENSRRSQADRRAFGASETELKQLEEIQTRDKRLDSDRRATSDRRKLDTNSIYNIEELDYFINSKNSTRI